MGASGSKYTVEYTVDEYNQVRERYFDVFVAECCSESAKDHVALSDFISGFAAFLRSKSRKDSIELAQYFVKSTYFADVVMQSRGWEFTPGWLYHSHLDTRILLGVSVVNFPRRV